MKIFTNPSRFLAVAVAVAGALLAGGCDTTVPGSPAPGAGTPSTAAPTGAPVPRQPGATGLPGTPGTSPTGCTVTAVGLNQISMTGGGGRTQTTPEATEFACRTGPLVAITRIAGDGVTFRLDAVETLVAPGASATVGPYRITVVGVDAGTAVFQVDPPA